MSMHLLADQLANGLRHAATASTRLADLAAQPQLATGATRVLSEAGGGAASVRALQEATGPGASALREAWLAASDASTSLQRAMGAAEGANREATTLAAGHAGAAVDLLDTFVYGGGAHFSVDGLQAAVGRHLDGIAAAGAKVEVSFPRQLRAWERAAG